MSLTTSAGRGIRFEEPWQPYVRVMVFREAGPLLYLLDAVAPESPSHLASSIGLEFEPRGDYASERFSASSPRIAFPDPSCNIFMYIRPECPSMVSRRQSDYV